MIYLYILFAVLIYLAIGGLLSGIFEDWVISEPEWIFGWPVIILIVLIYFISKPFQKLGAHIAEKFREVFKR